MIVLERVPPGLKGELTRWLLEPRPGIFLGEVSALVRDKLWELACQRMRSGGGILVYTTNNEQGFAWRLHGDTTRVVRDFEGLSLVTIPQNKAKMGF